MYIRALFVIIIFMKTKVIIVVCIILAVALVGVLSLAVTVSAKGYERFTVSDKLTYDENSVAEAMAKEKDLCLAKDGKSDYIAIFPFTASQALVNDVQYFAYVFNKMTGAGIRVVSDKEAKTLPQAAFVFGDTDFSAGVSVEGVKDDGYRVYSDGNVIYIKALKEAGVRNGIYGFLEDKFEVMFIEENYDYIPFFPTIYLDKLDYISNPDVAWRRVYQYEILQNHWYSRLRLNGFPENDWGKWCHSSFDYVPPEEYFESNPEYFALVDGERKTTQLCFSYFLDNEDAFEVIASSLERMIQENPDATYWDFSVMDNNDYCQCDRCKSILDETGSMMGTLLPLVNKLAERFPDVTISTLAYLFCKEVPKGIVPSDNVNIVVAPIGTSQNYSLAKGTNYFSSEGKRIIEEWGKVAPNLIVWDYVVNFSNLLMPYPNLGVQQSNLEFYLANNVDGVYHQGNREKEGEMSRMRSYLLSRQLWDSDIDLESLAAKYVQVAYKEAAKDVAVFMDKISDIVYYLPGNLDLYDSVSKHKVDYLAVTSLNEYEGIIRSAMSKVEPGSKEYERIERIYMSLMYTRCMDSSLNVDKKTASAQEFVKLADKYGVTMVGETVSLEEWYAQFNTEYLEDIKGYRIALITVSSVFPMILIGFALMVATTGALKKKIVIENLKKEAKQNDKDEDEIQTL